MLVFGILVSLTVAGGIVRLQRQADTSRQTGLALLNALDAAGLDRAEQQRGLAGMADASERKTWAEVARREAAAMQAAARRDPGSPSLAHVLRAFQRYQQSEAKEQQALAGRRAGPARSVEASQTWPAWQVYRQSIQDAAEEYDRRAASSRRITEAVTGLGSLAAILCLCLCFRRFAPGRYDVAHLTSDNEILRRSEKRFRSLVQNASEVVAILVEDGTAVYVSPAVRRMWGHPSESLTGRRLFELISPDGQAAFEDVFQQARARAGKNFTTEASVQHRNGTWRSCDVVLLNLLAEPEIHGIVVTFRDVTQLKQGQEALRQAKGSLEVRVRERTADLAKANEDLAKANEDLAKANEDLAKANKDLQAEIRERQALEVERERLLAEALERADRDPLTGLLNHRSFHKKLEEEADRAQRQNAPLAIAVLDLDNFKFFNDAYGHLVGDEVLREVAGVLKSCCRSYDTLARYGGDEFALLMPGTSRAEAPALAERLRLRLEEAVYRPAGSETAIPLSMSMGLSVFPDDEPGRLAALELADSRLMRAKTGAEDTDEAEVLRKSLNASVQGFSMLDALVTAVNNKDRYTRRHSEDVMTYSLQIAREMGMDAQAQETLATAALLHDVGKIGVPDFVLRKPSSLTAEEIEIIKHHPFMGAVIVAAVPGLEETLDAVRHHHERWDGEGYPWGLKGLEIPFSARLMAVADAFSAMTTDRPYRKGHPEARALGFLSEGSGTQWDPECVTAFLSARRRLHESEATKQKCSLGP